MVILKGSRGVRAGWRFLLFVGLLVGLGYLGQMGVFAIAKAFNASDTWLNALAPVQMLIAEASSFVPIALATFIMAKLEKRGVLDYGFTPSPLARPQFLEGAALGAAATAVIAVLMICFGGMQIHGFGLQGAGVLYYPLGWLAVMLLVGFTEEPMFRGYGLYALSRGIGFWPAAIVMTALFGLAHMGKPGENAVDITSVVLLGFFMCFTIWMTGSLWLAAGFHFAFDYMQFFVIGTRNGSQTPEGTLFNVSFPGPAWINGGPLGTEASYFVFPIALALFAYVAWRYRGKAAFSPPT